MPEDNFERRMDEESRVLMLREQVGRPPQEEINDLMKGLFLPIKASMMRHWVENREQVLRHLKDNKEFGEKRVRRPVSRRSVCAVLLKAVLTPLLDQAKKSYDEGNVKAFRFFFDVFEMGGLYPLDRILEAEETLRSGDDTKNQWISYESKKWNLPASQGADLYLQLNRRSEDSLGLMRTDPSGFSLMDDCVERIRTGSYPGGETFWYSKDFMLAGVELVRDVYKSLYEIAAPLYPEKPSK